MGKRIGKKCEKPREDCRERERERGGGLEVELATLHKFNSSSHQKPIRG